MMDSIFDSLPCPCYVTDADPLALAAATVPAHVVLAT